jgi:hypothetical protein
LERGRRRWISDPGLLVFFNTPVHYAQGTQYIKKKKKRVLGFKFLSFLGDGFGVKEKKKKAGTGGLCPTVTGTH